MSIQDNSSTHLQVDCPHCDKPNSLHFHSDVICGHCRKSLLNYRYKGDGKSGSVVLPTIVGAAASLVGMYVFNPHIGNETPRYSSQMEFTILDYCIRGDTRDSYPNYFFERKRDYCICLLEKTREKYTVEKLIEGGGNSFKLRLLEHRNECSESLSSRP